VGPTFERIPSRPYGRRAGDKSAILMRVVAERYAKPVASRFLRSISGMAQLALLERSARDAFAAPHKIMQPWEFVFKKSHTV
jgi:hypothetical protein